MVDGAAAGFFEEAEAIEGPDQNTQLWQQQISRGEQNLALTEADVLVIRV